MTNAWHFLKSDWRTGYGDLLVTPGETLTYSGEQPVILEQRGLHASRRIIDALSHAPGPVVTLVECGGPFVEVTGDTKFVCNTRKVLWGYDASAVLRKFGRIVAKEAVDKYYTPKYGKLPSVVMEWLETGNEDLRSAAYSASSAAESTTYSMVYSVRSAAYSTSSAASSAAYSAAYYAAYSANSAAYYAAYSANSAAYYAAYSANSAAKSAARSAAYSASSAHNELLEKMILEGLEGYK